MASDFWFIQKIKNGDDEAIDDFVRQYYPKIFQYCLLHISDNGHAEELTQETFMRFFKSLKSYRHQGKVAHYLYVIAANICKDYYKKTQEISYEDISAVLVQDQDFTDVRMDIEMALAKLPDDLKEVVILFFFQDIKQKEIAKLLGIKLSLVKYRISRGKKLLAEYLGKEDE